MRTRRFRGVLAACSRLSPPCHAAREHPSTIASLDVAGIPKFYRWLSERFPLVNEPVGAAAVPIFDALYLDMNGIIHNCTHGNDPSTKLTETEMVLRIFNYLDKLVQIVKPQQLLFMAIDGAAQSRVPCRDGQHSGTCCDVQRSPCPCRLALQHSACDARVRQHDSDPLQSHTTASCTSTLTARSWSVMAGLALLSANACIS